MVRTTSRESAPAGAARAAVRVADVHKSFGGLRAVDGVSLEIEKGAITGLIGPNGAGKTTLFNVVCGALEPTRGQVFLEDREITGLPPHELFGLGVLRTFQIAREFPTLSVLENLMMVPGGQSGENLISAWFRRREIRRQEAAVRDKAMEVAEFLNLAGLADEPAGNLSGGQKKLLELGRTMMVDAKVVFLDEVGAGINRTLLSTIVTSIRRLNREFGYTFCLIEHDMEFINRLCDHVVVMAEGAILTEGTAERVLTDRRVISAYLGSGRQERQQ